MSGLFGSSICRLYSTRKVEDSVARTFPGSVFLIYKRGAADPIHSKGEQSSRQGRGRELDCTESNALLRVGLSKSIGSLLLYYMTWERDLPHHLLSRIHRDEDWLSFPYGLLYWKAVSRIRATKRGWARVLLSKRVGCRARPFFHSGTTIAEEWLFHERRQTKGDLFQKEINALAAL